MGKDENAKQDDEDGPNGERAMIDEDDQGSKQADQGKVSDEDEEEDDGGDDDYEFRLVGVVCHMGSADAGHYLSYINAERDHDFTRQGFGQSTQPRQDFFSSDKYKWYEFNDSSVSSFKVAQLESTCYGGAGNNQNAYMLVYEKRLKHEMKVVIPKEVMDKSLARDGTAMTRQELSKQYHLFEVFPKLFDQI